MRISAAPGSSRKRGAEGPGPGRQQRALSGQWEGSCLSSPQAAFNSIIPFYEFTFPSPKRSVPVFADKTNRSALNISIT